MKAALDGVRWAAEMMRSPSFSRDGESKTMRKSPAAVKEEEVTSVGRSA